MSRADNGTSAGRPRVGLLAAVIVLAFLFFAGTALTRVMAGPAQEKGQEEPKEKKDQQKKFTNKDLKRGSGPSTSGGEAPAAGEGGESTAGTDQGDETGEAPQDPPDPWDSVGVATDDQGRGETYWRQAMSDAKGAVTAAKAEKDRLQSEMNKCQVDFTAIDDPAVHALVADRIDELFELLAEADTKVADAEQALSDLEEDARRSGALPGWLR
jgi:hypothetical protein